MKRLPAAALATLLACLFGTLLVGSPAAEATTGRLDIAATEALPLPGAWPAPFLDQLEAPDYVDLWEVSLSEGQQIIANMTAVNADDDIDLCLWAPGTTDFSDPSGASLAHSAHYSGAESFKYIVPAGSGGTYYIGVWWDQLGSLSGGSYKVWVSVQSPSRTAVRVTPPAVRPRVRLGRAYKAWGTLRPLHYAGESSVKVVWQKRIRGRWRTDDAERPVNLDYYNGKTRYTRYRVAYTFIGSGHGTMRWRVRAIHLADSLHPRKASAWRYFVVWN